MVASQRVLCGKEESVDIIPGKAMSNLFPSFLFIWVKFRQRTLNVDGMAVVLVWTGIYCVAQYAHVQGFHKPFYCMYSKIGLDSEEQRNLL